MVPPPYLSNSGTLKIIVSNNFLITRVYTLSGAYPARLPAPFSGTSMACQSIANLKVGENGNIECTISIPFTSLLTPMTSVSVNFLNTGSAELSTIYADCEAYLMSSSTPVIPSKKQLICSRRDGSWSNPVIFVSDISFNTAYTVKVKFRARIKALDSFTIEVTLGNPNSANIFYTYLRESNLALSFTSSIVLTSNLEFSFLVIVFCRKRSFIIQSFLLYSPTIITIFYKSI